MFGKHILKIPSEFKLKWLEQVYTRSQNFLSLGLFPSSVTGGDAFVRKIMCDPECGYQRLFPFPSTVQIAHSAVSDYLQKIIL